MDKKKEDTEEDMDNEKVKSEQVEEKDGRKIVQHKMSVMQEEYTFQPSDNSDDSNSENKTLKVLEKRIKEKEEKVFRQLEYTTFTVNFKPTQKKQKKLIQKRQKQSE